MTGLELVLDRGRFVSRFFPHFQRERSLSSLHPVFRFNLCRLPQRETALMSTKDQFLQIAAEIVDELQTRARALQPELENIKARVSVR